MTNTSSEVALDYVYWERNMLALLVANIHFDHSLSLTGWYVDPQNGWKVISISNGEITFHVPPDFECVGIPEISPNWDGHTTEEKWKRIKQYCKDEYFIDPYE